jgi:oligogalacturonide lyase
MKVFAMTAAAVLACLVSAPTLAQVGKVYPSEKRVMTDAVTGRRLILLTNGTVSDAKMYPTDQQWAFDGKHIVFRSGSRSGDGRGQIFAIDEASGAIVQLTDGPGVYLTSIMVSRLANEVFYLRRGADGTLRLYRIALTPLLSDADAGKVSPKGYETLVATLPQGFILAGGFTLDANGATAYVGFDQIEAPPRPQGQPVPQVPGGLLAVDLKTGQSRVVVKTGFRIGHVQANPFRPGEILYCNETGGDAPQRMWVVNADGTNNRPVFAEAPTDWVTHEQFADADHVIFNLMGHTADLRQRPTGIMVVGLRDGAIENLGQVPVRSVTGSDRTGPNSFWHNGVSYDGRFAAGDDFDGDVWLIDRKSGAHTLLTTGHVMKPDHAHPSFSPDGGRILIQSGLLTQAKKLSLIIVPLN